MKYQPGYDGLPAAAGTAAFHSRKSCLSPCYSHRFPTTLSKLWDGRKFYGTAERVLWRIEPPKLRTANPCGLESAIPADCPPRTAGSSARWSTNTALRQAQRWLGIPSHHFSLQTSIFSLVSRGLGCPQPQLFITTLHSRLTDLSRTGPHRPALPRCAAAGCTWQRAPNARGSRS